MTDRINLTELRAGRLPLTPDTVAALIDAVEAAHQLPEIHIHPEQRDDIHKLERFRDALARFDHTT